MINSYCRTISDPESFTLNIRTLVGPAGGAEIGTFLNLGTNKALVLLDSESD